MLTRIHINQHVIKANWQHGRNDPVITVKQGKKNTYCHSVEVLGPSKVVYRPLCPLSCGDRVWIETRAEVVIGMATEREACDAKEKANG